MNRKSECWRGFTAVLAIAGATFLYVVDAGFISDECTGRFAGAVGTITRLAPVPPNGYLVEGTISTVGATKK